MHKDLQKVHDCGCQLKGVFLCYLSSPLSHPQVRWTKTAGSASDKFQETSIFNETLRIVGITRVQGGRYYCKAENGIGVAAIKSIRVDVQCKC